MEIKIIGKNSSKRDYLFAVVQTALWELKLNVNVIKIDDEKEIKSSGITHDPSMLINDKLLIEGIVPAITEVKKIIKENNDIK